MTKASIISIGNEILYGQIADTNAAYISRSLFSIGIAVVSSYTVADDIDSIIKSMKSASRDAELVIATGGLGPTDDDLTRQAFAKFLGTKLELQNELLEKIHIFFTTRKLQMPQKCKIQAYIP
ncbi:MAG: molybdopterin-binding protein, partial [Planctomycetota bacterium]